MATKSKATARGGAGADAPGESPLTRMLRAALAFFTGGVRGGRDDCRPEGGNNGDASEDQGEGDGSIAAREESGRRGDARVGSQSDARCDAFPAQSRADRSTAGGHYGQAVDGGGGECVLVRDHVRPHRDPLGRRPGRPPTIWLTARAPGCVSHRDDDGRAARCSPEGKGGRKGSASLWPRLAKNLRAASELLVRDYGGNAENIWPDNISIDELKRRLSGLPHMGPS